MTKFFKIERRHLPLFIAILLILAGCLVWISSYFFTLEPWWRNMTRESMRILGLEKGKTSPEEKRIREEVILKKMEEARAEQDWRSLAKEYPRPKKLEMLTEGERLNALKDSSEIKGIEKELRDYLRNKEYLLTPESPLPSSKETIDFARLKDKGTEKIIESLLNTNEKTASEKPLEENVTLGIKGPLTNRRIVERPNLPPTKVRAEAEIELTLFVLPNGIVDRVVPSVKGDAELERIAIQYLKQWRFVPLSKDQAQVEQWGTIPIKFKLQ
jgi:TonB family protein